MIYGSGQSPAIVDTRGARQFRYMRYSEEEKERMVSYPVPRILAEFGCRTVSRKAGASVMFYSPFHEEKTPSFSYMESTNCWKDWSTGEGGGVLDLVKHLGSLDDSGAWEWLAQRSLSLDRALDLVAPSSHRNSEPAAPQQRRIIITDLTLPFTDPALIAYAAARGWSEEVLNMGAFQLSYTMGRKSGRAIGFPNWGTPDGLGSFIPGYALRGPDIKRCTNQNISTFSAEGRYSRIPASDTVLLMEGGPDFLSYLEEHRGRGLVSDICYLNTVHNLGRALEYLRAHRTINVCLDNDKAGREYLQKVMENCPGSRVIDRSSHYAGYKDYNEYLQAMKASESESLSEENNLKIK